MGVIRSAHRAKSLADGDVSASRASRRAAAAEAAAWSAAAAGIAAESDRWSCADRAEAGIAPKEKARASVVETKSAI
eukprot:1274987-Pleurochrysis_carterae.AAC.1